MSWGDGLDHARNTAHVRPQGKNGSKTENLKICDRADHFGVIGYQNRIKNDRVIAQWNSGQKWRPGLFLSPKSKKNTVF